MAYREVPCEPTPECKYYPNCYQDVHHEAWPEREYLTTLERVYRDMPENQVFMCRAEHDNTHADQSPPEKPSREEMLRAIAGSMLYISSTKRKKLFKQDPTEI